MPNRFLIGAAQGLGKADIVGEMRRKEDMLEQRRKEAIASQEAMRRSAYQQEQDNKKYELETQKQTDLNTYRNNALKQKYDQQIARQEQINAKNPPPLTKEEYEQTIESGLNDIFNEGFQYENKSFPKEKYLSKTGRYINNVIGQANAINTKSEQYKNEPSLKKGLLGLKYSTYGGATPVQQYQENVPQSLRDLIDKKKGILTQDFYQSTNFTDIAKSKIGRKAIEEEFGVKDPKEQDKVINFLNNEVAPFVQSFGTVLGEKLTKKYGTSRAAAIMKQLKNEQTGSHLTTDNPRKSVRALFKQYEAIEQLVPTENRFRIDNSAQEQGAEAANNFNDNLNAIVQPDNVDFENNNFAEGEGGDIPENLNQNELEITPQREQQINQEIQNSEVAPEKTLEQIFSQNQKIQSPEVIPEKTLEEIFNNQNTSSANNKNIVDQPIDSSIQQVINKYKDLPEFQNALIKTPVALQVIGQGAKDIARDVSDLIDEGHPELKELLFGSKGKVKQFEEDNDILSRILKAAPELAAYEAGVGLLGKATKLFRAGKQFESANPILSRVLNNTVYDSARTALHEKDNRVEGAMKGALQGAVFGTLGEGIVAPLKKAPKLATKAGSMLEEEVANKKLSLFEKKNELNAIENVNELKQLKQQEKEFQGKDLKAESKSFLKEKFGIDLNKNANKTIAEDFKTQGIKNLEKAETGYGEIAENIGKKTIPLIEKIGIKADIQDKAKKIIKSALEEGKAQADIDKFTKKINKVETYQDLQDFVHGANKYFSEGERSAYQQILKEIKPVIEKRLDKVTEGKFSQSQKEYSNFKIAKEEIGIDKATIDAFERGELSQKDLFNKINSKHSDQIEKLILHPDKQNFKFLGEGGLKALAEKRLNELITKDPKAAPAKFQEFLQDIETRLDNHPELQVSLEKQAKEYEKFINQTEKEGSKLNEMLERAKIKEGQSSFENKILKESPEKLSLMRDKLKAEIKNIEQYIEDPDKIKNFIAKARGDKDLTWKDYLFKAGTYAGTGGAYAAYDIAKVFSKKLTENIAKADIQGLTSTTRQILTILNKNFAKISSSLLNSTSKKEGR